MRRMPMRARESVAAAVVLGVGLVAVLLGAAGSGMLSPRPAYAVQTVRYVATTGADGANTCTDPAAPCATIQHAIDVAQPGDEIHVAAGQYSRAGTVAAVDKTLKIEGGYSDDFTLLDPESHPTVLDAQRQGSVVTATNVGDLYLHHLILTRGDGTGNCLNGCGGGIYARNSELRVGHCVISDSVANSSGSGWGQGGGVYASNGPFVHIWQSRIISNSAARPATTVSEGDGIFVSGGVVRIERTEILSNAAASAQGSGLSLKSLDALDLLTNTIRHNHTTRAGGGLFLTVSPETRIAGNVIEANRADSFTGAGMWLTAVAGKISRNVIRENGGGPGVDVYSSNPLTLTNNLIVGNGYGVSVLGNSPEGSWALLANNTIADNGPVGVRGMYTTTFVMTNTLVAGHTEGLRLQDPYTGTVILQTSLFWNTNGDPPGTIQAEPLLDPFYGPRVGSPALDGGTTVPWLKTDLRGDARPQGSGYDIGAYEGPGPGVFLPVVVKRE
jgi:nitrous oxidase accessory protein NosD